MGRITRVLTALSGFSFVKSGRLSRSGPAGRLDAEISSAEDSRQVRLGLAETPIRNKELVMPSGSTVLIDAAGRRWSPATIPGYLAGRAPHNKGMQFPPDPPRPEEIIVVMRQAGHDRHGLRMRALIAVLWRAGLRISEALALNETDIDVARGSLLIRHGKGDKRREAGMDQFGFEQLAAWMTHRVSLPVGPLFWRHRRPHPRTAVGRDRRPL